MTERVETSVPAEERKVRVLIVDDHEVVRMGLRSLLERRDEIAVIGEGGSAEDAVRLARELRPDVVVLDVRLPDASGVEACREIRSELPATKVIMLTSYSDDEALFASIMAGASGYLLKHVRGRDLADAIRTVYRGGSLLDPVVTQRVLERVRGGRAHTSEEEERLASLTPVERRILGLIADGMTNKEIADVLHLSDKTIKHYVSNILSKLHVGRRSEAAAILGRLEAKERHGENA